MCGAHNFHEGDFVVCILPGGVLPGPFPILGRKTYGHWSDGMHLSVKMKGVNKISEMSQAQLAQYMLPGGSMSSIGKLSSEELVAELRTLMIRPGATPELERPEFYGFRSED